MNREQAINYLRSSGMSEEQIESVVKALTEPAINLQPDCNVASGQDDNKSDLISRKDALRKLSHQVVGDKIWAVDARDAIENLPSTQPETISESYAKAVRTWLVNYQVKSVELKGRYTAYEVLGWIVSDWRKENEIW